MLAMRRSILQGIGGSDNNFGQSEISISWETFSSLDGNCNVKMVTPEAQSTL
jgi:hypothetical protein